MKENIACLHKIKNILKKVLLLITATTLTLGEIGCSTFVNDDTQHIYINSNIRGASIYRNGMDTGRKTPEFIFAKRSSDNLKITLVLPDGRTTKGTVESELDGTMYIMGNFFATIICPPFILGFIVDPVTGKMWKYPDNVNIDFPK